MPCAFRRRIKPGPMTALFYRTMSEPRSLARECATAKWPPSKPSSKMSAETRISELKLALPPAPKPAGVYKPVVIAGNLAYVSGHGPYKADKTVITGRVGADMDLPAGKLAARQVGLAILASLRAELGSLDRVRRLV